MTSDSASIAVPDQLRQTIVLWFGDRGQAWLGAVPGIARSLAEQWHLKLGPAYADSTNALVLPVLRSDDSPAVLKVPFVYEHNRHEADALRHYQGNGAVVLEDFDLTTGALLLECLEPGTPLADYADRSAFPTIGCELLHQLWSEVGSPHPFRSLGALADEWAACIPADFERSKGRFPEELVTEAVSVLRALGTPEPRDVLVNHDLHLWNILAGKRQPWLLIDPKPLVGDRAFDVGQLAMQCLGEDRSAAHARQLLLQLSRELGVQYERARGWAFVRAVKNAQSVVEAGADPNHQIELARTFQAVA
jgi:streptomycin 6-kinase